MKKYIYIIFLLLIIIYLFFPFISYAQEETPQKDINGVTCGVPVKSGLPFIPNTPDDDRYIPADLSTSPSHCCVPPEPPILPSEKWAPKICFWGSHLCIGSPIKGLLEKTLDPTYGKFQEFTYELQISNFKSCTDGSVESVTGGGGGCYCYVTIGTDKLCEDYLKGPELDTCKGCSAQGGVHTAIGCIDLDIGRFFQNTVFGFGLGLGGVIALLCIIYSSILIQTSQGNPEKIKRAKENATSCILGLLLIIFSVLILRIIGIDILQIPGFSI